MNNKSFQSILILGTKMAFPTSNYFIFAYIFCNSELGVIGDHYASHPKEYLTVHKGLQPSHSGDKGNVMTVIVLFYLKCCHHN